MVRFWSTETAVIFFGNHLLPKLAQFLCQSEIPENRTHKTPLSTTLCRFARFRAIMQLVLRPCGSGVDPGAQQQNVCVWKDVGIVHTHLGPAPIGDADERACATIARHNVTRSTLLAQEVGASIDAKIAQLFFGPMTCHASFLKKRKYVIPRSGPTGGIWDVNFRMTRTTNPRDFR